MSDVLLLAVASVLKLFATNGFGANVLTEVEVEVEAGVVLGEFDVVMTMNSVNLPFPQQLGRLLYR